MNTPLNQVKQAVEGAALNAVNKQEGWVKANAKPLILGAIVGALLTALALHFL